MEHTPVCTAKSLVKHIKHVLQVYNRAGFTVRYIMMDGELEKVKELLPTITTLVQTVRSNYEGFTKKDIKAAKAACKLQGMIGIPSEKYYK